MGSGLVWIQLYPSEITLLASPDGLEGLGPQVTPTPPVPLLVLDCTLSLPQCSSLMLIESTRDSLCFTVTHYKHSKQQYNIQVRVGRLGTDLPSQLAWLY